MDNIEQDILKYFQKYWWFKKVTLETTINNDIGISGDEWDIVLEHFIKKYNVDFSKLDYEKYFIEEMNVSEYWIKQLHKKNVKMPITVQHMVEVVKRKEWFDPNVEAE